MTKTYTEFHTRLTRMRKARHWTTERLAAETNQKAGFDITSRDMIARTENGQRVTLPLGEAMKFSEALGTAPEYLLFTGDDPKAPSVFSEFYGLTNHAARQRWSTTGKRTGVTYAKKRKSKHPTLDVVQKDKEGNILNVFAGVNMAERWLKEHGHPKAGHTNITGACQGKRHSAYGYLWEYRKQR